MKLNNIYTFSILVICLLLTSCMAMENQDQTSPIQYKHPIAFNPERYICYRTEETIQIDGQNQEKIWDQAPWTKSFVDIEGDLKPKPELETKVKMLWDDTYFYVYAQMEEPHVWATLMQRDTVIFYDDDFEIFIDPDGDSHGYYEFEANPFNTLWELLILRPYRVAKDPKVVNEWNIRGIKTATHIEGTINNPSDEDNYWSIEWAIPWSALGELAPGQRPPKNKEQWRVNFSRVDWPMEIQGNKYQKAKDPDSGNNLHENNWVWSATGRINMHMPEMWGYVQFSDIIAGTGETQFKYDPDEEIKWALWQLYFQQIEYHNKNGEFTDDLRLFSIPKISSPECSFEPKIYITPNLFEIINESCTENGNWSIRQDGKIILK